MFHRLAVLTFSLMVSSVFCAAQIGSFPASPNVPASPNFPSPRMGQPMLSDQNMGHDVFNSLSGSVLGRDNRPLHNVRVELRSSTGSLINSVYTGSSGNFEFAQVSSGSYQVVASSGVQQAETRVELHGMPSSVVLRLSISGTADDGNGNGSVSVAEYKVPEKAREALRKAREALGKGKNDEAQKQVAKALELYPQYADALTLRAVLKMNANDLPGATADLQEAISDDVNCALAYIVTGAVFNMQMKFDDAIRSLQRGQSLSPNSWQAYFEMGKAFLGKTQYSAALSQFERSETLLPNGFLLLHLAKAHAMIGLRNYTDAVTELQAYLAKAPEGPRSEEAQKLLTQAQAAAERAEMAVGH